MILRWIMDWRGRKYYCVSFDWRSMDMRIEYLKLIDGIRIHPYRNIPKQPDEVEERGFYQLLISVPIDRSETVEYEFRKAERNDGWCKWKEIKRDVSKKYFDVLGFEIPYRRCDFNPNKRCNRCMCC